MDRHRSNTSGYPALALTHFQFFGRHCLTREEDDNKPVHVLWLGELTHRGQRISRRLTPRRSIPPPAP